MTVATFGNLYSAPTVTREQSICRSWRLWGGAADLLSSGQEHPCCPGPSGPLPVPGEAKSWDVSWRPCSGACAVGFALLAVQPPLPRAAAQPL